MSKFGVYSPKKKRSKGEIPPPPFVSITIAEHTGNEQGDVFLTPQLVNDKEIDHYIDDLKKKLDKVGRLAKKELKNYKDWELKELKKDR